tara:strand:+ start:154 stop:765 length:612 start_codon:yes stop_codon:yes gene_type:complete
MDVQKICDKLYPLVLKHREQPHVELEMRLGKFNGKMFDTNVGKVPFYRVLSGLQKYMGWEKVVGTEHEVFYRESDGVRISVDEATGDEAIIHKQRVLNEDFKKIKETPYDVRFSVSTEHPLPPDTDRNMDKKKTKKRISFIRKNLSIDMTISIGDSHDMDAEDPTSYQIEFEIIDPMLVQSKDDMFNIIHKMKDVFKLLDTNK